MIPDEEITLQDLSGKEIELLIRYRLMTDDKKRQTQELVETLAADQKK